MKSVLTRLDTVIPIPDLMALPPDGGLRIEPDFGTDDREALRQQLGLLALNRVKGALIVKRWRGKGLSVRGQLLADITQACVVTLDPVEQHVRVDVDVMLFPGVDPVDMESDIDPLPADHLQTGALIAEHLALAVDPYPRKTGVQFTEIRDETGLSSPFEALRALKSGDTL